MWDYTGDSELREQLPPMCTAPHPLTSVSGVPVRSMFAKAQGTTGFICRQSPGLLYGDTHPSAARGERGREKFSHETLDVNCNGAYACACYDKYIKTAPANAFMDIEGRLVY